MCGRFALGLPRPQIIRQVHDEHPELDLDLDEWIDEDAFYPRYNVAPRSRSPVVRRRNRYDDRAASEEQGETEQKGTVMHTMKWGVVPHWSKHEDTNLNTINAKGENLTEGGGMWASIKGRKRCVVVCQGYYEWQKRGKDRLPHFTRHKEGKLMLLAGLYDSVILEGHTEPLYTYTIVTTDANKQLSWLHDRMPVILSSAAQIEAWLDTSDQTWSTKAAKVIKPYTSLDKAHDLECYPVPKEVGKVSAESATFIEPISKRKDGIEAMFAKQSKGGKDTDTSFKPASQPSQEKKSQPSGETGEQTLLKRKRESTEQSPKKERASSVELLSVDEPSGSKKARTDNKEETKRSGKQVAKPKTPSSSQSTNMKSPKSSKSPKSPEQASPGTKKITSFFSKTEDNN
ncbi:DUF159-domain-containing protein [Fomitiporia mediterranea MF3/22]|uniref:DUF159-domain-containing protein n=1 Tax=Fomitiporia mediterranea (strain MF3/22) TaxID=694068 RepID=UPI00044091FA|nr:DUF159-domain-containing protein [Fomitiporia mediterranea MF3/22]EJD04916.1 DUF159-domain-containing protein [Fomitiporia mediterranea MF3/22]